MKLTHGVFAITAGALIAMLPTDRPQPSISVAMCTYNGARYLTEQLNSLLEQDLLPHELQVGDDGSSDGTLDILAEFARNSPFPVHVVTNRQNLGYGENFLQTAKRCSGDWIAFCDQDDVWALQKLTRCASAIAAGPDDLKLVVHAASIVDSQLRKVGLLAGPAQGLYSRLELKPGWFCQGFRQVVSRDLLDDFPIADRAMHWDDYPEAHDTWICLMATVGGSVRVIDDLLVIYRRHEANLTFTPKTLDRSAASRLTATIRDNTYIYLDQAAHLRTFATYLRARANAPGFSYPMLLSSAADKTEAYANWLSLRSEAQGGARLLFRLRAFARLLRVGAYSNGTPWSFGIKSAVKDLVMSVRPSRFRS